MIWWVDWSRSIAVVHYNEWWFILLFDVCFIGEARIFTLESLSLTKSKVDGEVVIFNTGVLPGVEIVGHGDIGLMAVVDHDVQLVVWCASDTTWWLGESVWVRVVLIELSNVIQTICLPGTSLWGVEGSPVWLSVSA